MSLGGDGVRVLSLFLSDGGSAGGCGGGMNGPGNGGPITVFVPSSFGIHSRQIGIPNTESNICEVQFLHSACGIIANVLCTSLTVSTFW